VNEPQGPLFGELLVKLGLASSAQVAEALKLQEATGQRVGEALISLGYVRRQQLQKALAGALGLNDSYERPSFGELLIRLKHVTAEQLETARAQQAKDGRRLGEILVDLGFCSLKQVYEALALQDRPGYVAMEAESKKVDRTRVLVVDDSPFACAFVEEGLTTLGYEVHAFQDPLVALDAVHRLKPTIVLSDLEMPELDGAALCRRLKDGPARNIPVILLTANDAEVAKLTGLQSGADDYVNKATSMAELSARIQTIVRRTGATERMRKLFARYTSDAVVDEILKSGEIVLTGEKREATVLFADLRDFTAFAESLPPEEVVDVLNDVLARLADAVLTCGGTLDKFLGDGLMAVFGAPVKHADDALRAVQCAGMMMASMRELEAPRDPGPQTNRRLRPAAALRLGIGINTGQVVAGSFGSALRTEYTCIGDVVNVAARLCSAAQPREVLVGEATRERCGSDGKFEALPPLTVKGKSQPVALFRVLWETDLPRR
jgi:adenylate cyclase